MDKLFIVRHCVTDFNEKGRYLGCLDDPLNDNGRKQATELNGKISKINFDIIISSPLKRTIETAEIIKPVDFEILIDQQFIQRSVGVYEGLTKEEAQKKYPDQYKRNITRIFDQAPTGGETITQVEVRIFKGLDQLLKKYKNKNILIVTHAFIGKVINKYFNRQISDNDFFDFTFKNGEIKEYSF